MISMIRAMVRLCTVVAAVAAFLPPAPSHAADAVAYASSTGSTGGGTSCPLTQPCGNLPLAIIAALGGAGTDIARVICLTPVSTPEDLSVGGVESNETIEVDCPDGFMTAIGFGGSNMMGVFRGVTFTRATGPLVASIFWDGSGTLILENCAFVDVTAGIPLDLEPNGPLHLVIKNCRISNSNSGILLKPASGGSITATFDHVTITGNAGGGLKIDTTNGPVTVDITDSVVSNNAGNGINAVGAVNQNMVSIKNSVIVKNGAAGIQANGASAGVLVQTTLLDQNAAGATTVLNGGHISTYGNNSIVGSAGSGFTGSATLQ
jgi:hypothetical protein